MLFKSFNSIKVRLKQAKDEGRHSQNQFQFHKGPIKAHILAKHSGAKAQFQFHKGPIKAL